MSERIPTAEDIRLALIEVGYTHYEADDAIEAVKRSGIGIGHEMARDAVRKLRRIAWDEGYESGLAVLCDGPSFAENPYREGEDDE